jgi:hypothetical protein
MQTLIPCVASGHGVSRASLGPGRYANELPDGRGHAGALCAQTRLGPRRHSLVLRRCFGKPIVCGVDLGDSVGQTSGRDPGPRPH